MIVDISLDEEEPDYLREDDAGWLAALAPLRRAVIAGDLRVFYLAWLYGVQHELVPDDEVEPMPGIGPLTGALEAFAKFFGIDADLVKAAAEVGEDEPETKDGLRKSLSAISEDEKTDLLARVLEGDAYVAGELAKRAREKDSARGGSRTALALRSRMLELEEARERADADRREAQRRHLAEKAAKERRVRVDALRKRGDVVWHEIEADIELRLPQSYDRAILLLSDLQALAMEQGSHDDFARRMASIRTRHARKRTFIERLSKFGLA